MKNETQQQPNRLIDETSPYLLQHAFNPVDWHAWNAVTLEKAKIQNKLILVSVGYSACHWCHVMAHESFEDEEVAKIMNENFICIKVDREERPDVDQIYMDAVQLISGRGGWPLNCFALPDGRPFWGGTYFPKEQWKEILNSIIQLYSTQREKLLQQASEITEGIKRNDFINPDAGTSGFDKEMTDDMVQHFSARFDNLEGGSKGAPKFPMPNNLLFLLRYYSQSRKPEFLAHVELTLKKMAAGGIYDQIGGGFARYSVDEHWHIPHFEKMLYDNAQLVSLYSEAYKLTKDEQYKDIIIETLEFVKRELTSPEGGFYSSLDADSEGVEGKYYVWEKNELEDLLGQNAPIIIDYFGIDQDAYWENGKNVLIKAVTISQLAEKYNKPEEVVRNLISESREKLLSKRSERARPDLDDKILTSWNGLMVKGYVDAYLATGKNEYLECAVKNANFLLKNMNTPNGGLYRSYKEGKSTVIGFLEDYAFVARSFHPALRGNIRREVAPSGPNILRICHQTFL